MNDLTITYYNDVFNKITSNDKGILRELSDFLTFFVPGYKFMPSYKSGVWDGRIRLFNLRNNTLYSGLTKQVEEFCQDRGYSISYGPAPEKTKIKYSMKDVEKFLSSFQITSNGKRINLYEHQINSLRHCLTQSKRALVLSPTGSGKSAFIYSLIRFYQQHEQSLHNGKQILLIVPTVSLVSQMKTDFADYSSADNWNAEEEVHTTFSGSPKKTKKPIQVATWQILFRQPKSFFKNYWMVIGDECHLFQAKSLKRIMHNLEDCPIRIGTTGTLSDSKTHHLLLQGQFGPIYKPTSTKKLIEKKVLSEINITSLVLQHEGVKRMKYQDEVDYLLGCKKRNQYIRNLALSLEGNTLLLFTFVNRQEHGRTLFQMLEEKAEDQEIYYIDGSTTVEERERIRRLMNQTKKDQVLVASVGTFSTGVNIQNLHNIVFASPSKSKIRILQSIGRSLRRTELKHEANLFDVADNFGYKNYTLKHFLERMKIYNQEQFPYKVFKIKL